MNFIKLINNKIMSHAQLLQNVSAWKNTQQTIVFSNGCFDIIHPGHAPYLAQAAALGDRLIIGTNPYNSVTRLKGSSRPIIPEKERCLWLSSFQFVDEVCIFDEDTPLNLIKSIKPDILVKGKDYSVEQIVGADFVLQNGGKVETIDMVEGFSTSILIEKIKKL